MGIQINGQTDIISASDGNITVSGADFTGISNINATGISTFVNGPVLVGTSSSTGTASQPLQVTGGAYVSGNFGIGITNPTSKLQVQGDALITGVTTFQSSAYFGDSDFAYFGDSGDLYIGHNGSISAIADFGTGDLYIAGDTSLVITDLSYAENKAKFNTNGSVELYFDNSKKFETLGTGVTVTGITFTNQLSVSGVLTATSVVRSGGTSSQFLKADGSVDSSTYLTSYTETSTLANVTSRGNSTSNGISVSGIITATSVRDTSGNVRAIPQNAQSSAYILAIGDVGKHISITTGGVTVNSAIFSAGDSISIYNNSGSNQTITQGASVTMYLAGTATTGNRTLAQRGVCTVLCVASNTFVIFGAGLT